MVATVYRLTSIEYYLSWLGLDESERDEIPYSLDAPDEARGLWVSYGRFVRDGTIVEPADIRRLARGLDPRTGESLVQRNTGRRTVAYDLQLAAPKSASVLWALADDAQRQAVEAAQARAVRAALDMVMAEGLIETRRGKGGATREPALELAVATFAHSINRQGEAHLHTHCVIMNACVREDGSTGAIDNNKLLHHKLAIGAAYRAELARELHTLGLMTEADPRYQFGFRVKGVSSKLCAAQSKRRAQVEEALAKQGLSSADSGRLADIAAKSSRKSKAQAVAPEVLRARWRAEAEALGIDPARVWERAMEAGAAAGAGDDLPLPEAADRLVAEALVALSEQEAVLERRHVLRAALERAERQSPVRCGYAEITAAIERAVAAERLVRLGENERGPVYATPAAIETERRMLRAALSRQRERGFFTPSRIAMAAAARGLSAEQAAAVRHALGPDGVVVIEGRPGAGKSFAQGPVAKTARAAGYKVHAIAPTWRAAEILRRDTETLADHARALAEFVARLDLEHPEAIRLDRRTIIIVDEASMLGLRDATALVEAAAAAGAKLILTGDTKQLLGVGRGGGDPLSSLADKLGRAAMTRIRRQTVEWQREASEAAARGDLAAALFAYADHDRVVLADDRAGAVSEMAAAYVAARVASPQASMLMVGRRNVDVRDLNRRARAGLRAEGQLCGQDYIVPSAPRWAKGDEEPMALAVGDRLVFAEEVRIGRAILRTNTLATITAIVPGRNPDDPQVTIHADDRQVVSARWRDFIGYRKAGSADRTPRIQHAYAVNANAAQGETVDQMFVLGHGMRSRSALVALTRHRQDCHIYLERERLEALLAPEPILPLVVTDEGQLRARDAPPPEPKGETGVLELDPLVVDARTTLGLGGGEGVHAYLAVQARLWAAPEARENPSDYLAPNQAALLRWLGLEDKNMAAAYATPAPEKPHPAAAPADAGEDLQAAPETEAPVADEAAAPAAGDAPPGPVRRRKQPAKPPAARRVRKMLPLDNEADADPAAGLESRAEEDQHEAASPPSAAELNIHHPAEPEDAAEEHFEPVPPQNKEPAEPGVAEAQEAGPPGEEMAGDPIAAPNGAAPILCREHDASAAPEPAAPADEMDAPAHAAEEAVPDETAVHEVADPAGDPEAAAKDVEAQPIASGRLGSSLVLNVPAITPARDGFDLKALLAEEAEDLTARVGAPEEPLPTGAAVQVNANPLFLPEGKAERRQKGKRRPARRLIARQMTQPSLFFWDEMDAAAPEPTPVGRFKQAGHEVRPRQELLTGAGAAAAVDDFAVVAAPVTPADQLEGPAAVSVPPARRAAGRGADDVRAEPLLAGNASPDEAARAETLPDADPPVVLEAHSKEPWRDEPPESDPADPGAAGPPVPRLEAPPAWPVLSDGVRSSPASADALAARLAALHSPGLQQALRRRQFARKMPASVRPVMAELIERQGALQSPLKEIATSQRGMVQGLERAAERVGQAWAADRQAALQAAHPRFLLPAVPAGPKVKLRVISRDEIETHIAKVTDVSQARLDLRTILEATYRDPDRAARRLQMLRRQHPSAAAAAQHLVRQGAAILGPLVGNGWRILNQAEHAKRCQAKANAAPIGNAFVALEVTEAQQKDAYIEQVRAAEAAVLRRLAVAVPCLSRRAEAAIAALHQAGLRPGWAPAREQPTAEDCLLAAKIAPLWARITADPKLKAELERFMQAAAERLTWPRIQKIAAAVAARPDTHPRADAAVSAEEAEEHVAVLADVVTAARELHRLHPEFQRIVEIERCRSVMKMFPFGQKAPKPILALWRPDILGYAWRERPSAAEDAVQQDVILRWERVRAIPGAVDRLLGFAQAAETALPADRIREVALARQPDGSRFGIDRNVALVVDALSAVRTASALATANPDLAAQARGIIERERIKAREAARLQEIERCRSVLPDFPFGEDAPAALRALWTPEVFGYAWGKKQSAAEDPAQQGIILQWERVLTDKDVAGRIIGFRDKVLSILPRERIREIVRALRPDGTHPDADPDIVKLAYAVSVIDAAIEIHRANSEQAALARLQLEKEKVLEVQKLAAPKPAIAPRERAAGTTATIKGPGPGAGI